MASAFCTIKNLAPAADGSQKFTVNCDCVVLDVNDVVVGNVKGSAVRGSLSTIADVQAALIQDVRDKFGDPLLAVTFVSG